LLDVIAGRRSPTAGSVRVGSTVSMELFDQRGIELNPQMRVWQAVVGDVPKPEWQDTALMESFWFDSDAQYAPIELLSGGERRRLQLLITLAKKPNVLLLDEPTNDLDLDTLRVLEDFLENYPGAVVVVSHDRAFLERTVDDVIVFDGTGNVGRLPGGYEAYEKLRSAQAGSKNDSTRPTAAPSDKKSKQKGGDGGRSASTIRHELKSVEKDMARFDKKRAALTTELEAAGSDHEALVRVGAELTPVVAEIDALEERWLTLSEEAEG
jgi:ATP-binding cassette subfamily F protein uup